MFYSNENHFQTMPLVNVKSSIEIKDKTDDLLKKLSSKISNLTGKPEKYVMVVIESNLRMMFGGSKEGCCFIEIKSIGSLEPTKISDELCNLINNEIGIKNDRIYINFEDVQPNMWGYNNSTFG